MGLAGEHSTQFWRVMCLNILLVFGFTLSSCSSTANAENIAPTMISGQNNAPVSVTVMNEHGILLKDGVIVRIKNTLQPEGFDTGGFTEISCNYIQYVSAWAPGYFISSKPCNGQPQYPMNLIPFIPDDNTNYSWLYATQNCAGCHSGQPDRNEYSEWVWDGHSRIFVNPYFWTMYKGTDSIGNQGSRTVWEIGDAGQKRRNPNTTLYGPGYRLDYPNDNGNCAYCHAPAAVKALQQGMDLAAWNSNVPVSRFNVETEGVTCDICHKVIDVLVGEDRRPFADRTGIQSFIFARPSPNQSYYIGPRVDTSPENSQFMMNCSPVFSESKFCATCHYGKFFDTMIYNSYGEWLNSIYGQKETDTSPGDAKKENQGYRSCQDCHMSDSQKIGKSLPSARSACAEENLSFSDFSHNMMKRNANDIPTLVQNAARIDTGVSIKDGKIEFKVTVTNTGAGHKFPTDSPLRHLILFVEARDQNNTLLPLVEGPTIPLWGGVGSQSGDYAGWPGQIYANILKEKDTNIAPTVAYWNPTIQAWEGSDTRLIPGQPVLSEYSFATPYNGSATITAKLIYRYAFIDIARLKKWPIKDIDVTSVVCKVTPTNPENVECATINPSTR